MKAMILAAGRGQRMMPLTANTPKPMLEIAGKPLLEHHIERLRQSGITELVINHCYLGEQIESYFGSGEHLGVHIQWSRELHALETAGGICQALPLLDNSPFLIVNADVWTTARFEKLLNGPHIDALESEDQLAHLWLVDNPSHNPGGDFAITNGQIKNQGEAMLTYSGIAVLSPQVFAGCASGEVQALAPILRTLADQELVSGSLLSASWEDIGTPERLMKVQSSTSTV